MLSEKEVQYIRENIENENLLVTKFANYSEQATDASVKQVCKDIQNCHMQHVCTLSKQLNQ